MASIKQLRLRSSLNGGAIKSEVFWYTIIVDELREHTASMVTINLLDWAQCFNSTFVRVQL